LVIQQAAGASGTAAQVTVWSDVSGTLAVGAPNDVTVLFKNQQVRMTFAGVAGQNLGVDLANAAFGGTVQVIAPNGAAQSQQATFTAAGISIRAGAALTQSGTYTVIIVPASGATGGIRVTLWSDVTDALTIGAPFQLNITFRLQFAQLRFDGTAGQNLRITLTGVTLPASSVLQVLRPDGAAVVNVSFGAAGITADIPTLTSTGVHTVSIVPGGQGTGSAVVNVLNR